MGAKFAPSLANLFMAEWEDKFVFSQGRDSLLFYKRFIDDLFFVWEGTESSLHAFMCELNSNKNNIKLDYTYSKERIHFLDVNVRRTGNSLSTTVYFKPTDRNSYLPINSGHHPLWLMNIPKGQIMRIRRNCTLDSDFRAQATVIKENFVQKGYKEQQLDKIQKL